MASFHRRLDFPKTGALFGFLFCPRVDGAQSGGPESMTVLHCPLLSLLQTPWQPLIWVCSLPCGPNAFTISFFQHTVHVTRLLVPKLCSPGTCLKAFKGPYDLDSRFRLYNLELRHPPSQSFLGLWFFSSSSANPLLQPQWFPLCLQDPLVFPLLSFRRISSSRLLHLALSICTMLPAF